MDLEDKVQGQRQSPTLCLVGTESLYGTKAGLEQLTECWNNRHKKLGIALQIFFQIKIRA